MNTELHSIRVLKIITLSPFIPVKNFFKETSVQQALLYASKIEGTESTYFGVNRNFGVGYNHTKSLSIEAFKAIVNQKYNNKPLIAYMMNNVFGMHDKSGIDYMVTPRYAEIIAFLSNNRTIAFRVFVFEGKDEHYFSYDNEKTTVSYQNYNVGCELHTKED